MTIQAGMPRQAAAQARAAARLPLEGATTPRRASSSVREKTALVAPRILKEPVFWKLSHLKNNCAPARASIEALVRTGVRWMRGLMRSCAATIVSHVMGVTGCSGEGFEVAMTQL